MALPKQTQQLIEFLVREHLTMSHVAQKQDLSDPEVIQTFLPNAWAMNAICGRLYLLTVADIRGTSPKVWNAWKGKLLEDLYRASAAVLGWPSPRPRCRGGNAQTRGLGNPQSVRHAF